jgi:hypothetical protein
VLLMVMPGFVLVRALGCARPGALLAMPVVPLLVLAMAVLS